MLPVVSTTKRTLASERLTAARPPPIAGSAATISSSSPIAAQRSTPPREALPRRTHAKAAPMATATTRTITGTGTNGSNVIGLPPQSPADDEQGSEAGETRHDPRGRAVVGDDLRRNVEAARLEAADLGDDVGGGRPSIRLE